METETVHVDEGRVVELLYVTVMDGSCKRYERRDSLLLSHVYDGNFISFSL